jgi:hypothetical protein
MKSKATALGRTIIISLAIAMTAGTQFAFAQASHVRWDIISFHFGTPGAVAPGGMASATANDGSHITLRGSGTFVAPAGGSGSSSGVSGGGVWTTYSSKGAVTGFGSYEVTGLVLWEPSSLPPGGPPPPPTDLIEPSDVRSTGVAVLRIAYSDGDRGILLVSCESYLSPASAFEGITATKGLTDYKSPVPPVAGVDANRTLFHVEE